DVPRLSRAAPHPRDRGTPRERAVRIACYHLSVGHVELFTPPARPPPVFTVLPAHRDRVDRRIERIVLQSTHSQQVAERPRVASRPHPRMLVCGPTAVGDHENAALLR